MATGIFAAVIIIAMIAGCYLLSGSAIIAGSIFEKKTTVKKK